MKRGVLHQLKTIADYHALMQLPSPAHPLISVIAFEQIKKLPGGEPLQLVLPFYTLALKRNFNARMKYGQQDYDFNNGLMSFMSPGQVLSIEVAAGEDLHHAGWLLVVHPDFLWGTPLARKMPLYEFFGYKVHEALHLSEAEEATVKTVMENISAEQRLPVDAFSQNILVAQIEMLLTYAERFYHRQFLTRKKVSTELLSRLEDLLEAHFNGEAIAEEGLPTVQRLAERLNVSPNYLSTLLKVHTGLNAQQHLHNKLIEKAKEKLSTTSLSVSEIAYELGFEHSQSFSKLFKSKTAFSPLAFRQSFT